VQVLADSLAVGVAFYREALSENEREIVQQLFKSGAIQIVSSSSSQSFLLALSFC
jgi:replicative superfamily II helicase